MWETDCQVHINIWPQKVKSQLSVVKYLCIFTVYVYWPIRIKYSKEPCNEHNILNGFGCFDDPFQI